MTSRRLPREWGFKLVANALIGVDAAAQTTLPDIAIQPKTPAPAKPHVMRAGPAAKPRPGALVHTAPAQKPRRASVARVAPAPPPATPPPLDQKMKSFDAARDALLPKTGASVYTIGRETIENLPQGDNTPIDKVLLQAPGVAADSAIGGPNGFHVRNEYANVQYRINGVVLPEGFANMDHVPAYFVVNLGTSREFELVSGASPLTARFDVTNVSDRKYELRSGTGIGVFAPQYGARRGFFVGLSQKL